MTTTKEVEWEIEINEVPQPQQLPIEIPEEEPEKVSV